MEQFTADIQELNSRHSFIGEELAGELSNRFPRLQHAFSATNRDELAASGVQASATAEVIALLPLDSSPAARQALENAFQAITATSAETIVIDLDIADPHSKLLSHSGGEGISDHFLYGVSPERLLAPGPEGRSYKVISPGTFTPRAEEIYTDEGWNELIDSLSSSAPEATLLLLGPPAAKFPSLTALSKTGTVIVLSGRLDNDAQQALPAMLEKLEVNLPADAQLKLVWLDTEQPAETTEKPQGEEKPEENTPADQQPEPAEPDLSEDEVIAAETDNPAEETAPPAESMEEPQESTTADQQPEPAEIPLTEAGKISAEIDDFLEETEPPAEEPAPSNDSFTQLKADDISLDNEKLPGQRSLEDSVSDGVKDETFGDLELPDLSETSAEATNDTPQNEDDEEEIFLPDELLFLDEDEQAPLEASPEANAIIENSAASMAPEKQPEEFEPEAVVEQETEADESAPEIPDLSGIDVEDILPPLEEPSEIEQIPADELLPDQEEAAQTEEVQAPENEAVAEIEPLGEEETTEAEEDSVQEIETSAESDEEFDTDALFSDDDLDDEDEDKDDTPIAAAPGADEDLDDEALELIEKFRETSDKPQDAEPELALDDDPLGDGSGEQEPQQTEAAEIQTEPAVEPDATAETEIDAETEPVLEAEQELETEPVLETESEAEEITTAEDIELADEEAEPEEAMPAEADLVDITEGDAPLEAETAEEDEAVADAEPEAVEEMAELDAGELEEIETGDLESLDDEINTTAEDTDAAPAELEEIAEETVTAEADESDALDVPADDELDELLSGTDDLEDIDGGITLDDLDEIDDIQPAAAGKGGKKRKKKAASKSRGKPVAILIMLMVVGFGMFFIWKQGYVSKLVRQVPALTSIAGFIPATDKERQQEEEAIRQAAADSAELADSLSRIPPPPQYDKLGYSIQIGSYRYLPQALAVRDRLVQNGLQDVFVVPLELDSLGNWNRLYLGMYRSVGRGDTALQSLTTDLRRSGITDGASGGAIMRHTPLTLMVAETSDPDSLQAVMEKLETNYIPAYMIQLAEQDSISPPLYRLYSGAFENESQAVFLRRQIFNIGVRATVVEREGPAELATELQAAPPPPV